MTCKFLSAFCERPSARSSPGNDDGDNLTRVSAQIAKKKKKRNGYSPSHARTTNRRNIRIVCGLSRACSIILFYYLPVYDRFVVLNTAKRSSQTEQEIYGRKCTFIDTITGRSLTAESSNRTLVLATSEVRTKFGREGKSIFPIKNPIPDSTTRVTRPGK